MQHQVQIIKPKVLLVGNSILNGLSLKVIKEKIKPKTIIISNAPPTTDEMKNCNINIANALCQRIANSHKEVILCPHNLYYRQGKQDMKYFNTDGIHLNSRGTSILASNIKKSICDGSGLTLPYTSRDEKPDYFQRPEATMDMISTGLNLIIKVE